MFAPPTLTPTREKPRSPCARTTGCRSRGTGAPLTSSLRRRDGDRVAARVGDRDEDLAEVERRGPLRGRTVEDDPGAPEVVAQDLDVAETEPVRPAGPEDLEHRFLRREAPRDELERALASVDELLLRRRQDAVEE